MKSYWLFFCLLLFAGITVVCADTFTFDLTIKEMLTSDPAHVTLSSRNQVLPALERRQIVAEQEDNVFRFVLDEQAVYFIKFNKRQLVKQERDTGAQTVLIQDEGIITDVVMLDGNVYASLIPGAKIVRCRQQAEPFITLDCDYIWDMAPYPDGLAIVCGTPAQVVLIDTQGRIVQEHPLADLHGSAVCYDEREKVLYIGTGNNGLIYRLDPDSAAMTSIGQCPDSQIVGIHGNNGVYVLAATPLSGYNAGSGQGGVQVSVSAEAEGAAYQSKAQADAQRMLQVKKQEKVRTTLFRLDDRGHKQVLFADNIVAFAMVPRGRSTWLLSKDKGIIEVTHDPFDRYLRYQFLEKHDYPVCGFERDGMVYVSTGFSGSIWALDPEKVRETRFESQVFFLDNPITVGAIHWEKSGNAKLYLRTGYTALPDSSWQPWQEVSEDAGSRRPPPGRAFQFALLLAEKADALEALTMYARMEDPPCRLEKVQIKRDRMAIHAQKGYQYSNNGVPLKPLLPADSAKPLRIAWKTSNRECQGAYRYTLVFRDAQSGDDVFTVAPGTDTGYDLNMRLLPDGVYQVLVQLASIYREQVIDALLSESFVVDTMPPQVTVSGTQGAARVLSCRDERSIIALAYTQAVDGAIVYLLPNDGVFDSRSEVFTVTAPLDTPLVFHCLDEAGNTKKLLIERREKP